jgi:hypothetical protein
MQIRTHAERGSGEPQVGHRDHHGHLGGNRGDRARQRSAARQGAFQRIPPWLDHRGIGLRKLPHPRGLEDGGRKERGGFRSLPNWLPVDRATRDGGLQRVSSRRAARDQRMQHVPRGPTSVSAQRPLRQLSFLQAVERLGGVRDSPKDTLPAHRDACARGLHRVPSAQRRAAMDDGAEQLLCVSFRGLSRSERPSEPPRHGIDAAFPPGLLTVPRSERLEPRVHRPDRLCGLGHRSDPFRVGWDGDSRRSRPAFPGYARSPPRSVL